MCAHVHTIWFLQIQHDSKIARKKALTMLRDSPSRQAVVISSHYQAGDFASGRRKERFYALKRDACVFTVAIRYTSCQRIFTRIACSAIEIQSARRRRRRRRRRQSQTRSRKNVTRCFRYRDFRPTFFLLFRTREKALVAVTRYDMKVRLTSYE